MLFAVATFSVTAGAGRPGSHSEPLPGGTRAGRLQSNSDMYKRTRELLPRQFVDYEVSSDGTLFVVLQDPPPPSRSFEVVLGAARTWADRVE